MKKVVILVLLLTLICTILQPADNPICIQIKMPDAAAIAEFRSSVEAAWDKLWEDAVSPQ